MNREIHSYDILGSTALVKFSEDAKAKDKKKFADILMKKNKSIKTILEKTGKFKGRLRKQTTKFIAGENTKEVLYKENGCVFRFNIDKTYFSPRLSNERKEIASYIKRGDLVLVMFAGVAPFPIAIARNSSVRKVYSNEINREANNYAKMNIELNNVKSRVELLPGDIKKVAGKIKEKMDVIVMPRPQLKDSFLKEAFMLSKKGTRVYYYDFTEESKINSIVEKVKQEAEKSRKRVRIIKVKKAGEIGSYKYRVRVDFVVV